MSGDRAFAEDFFTRYMTGREVVDYARLFQRAGVVLRKTRAGRAWAGDLRAGQDGGKRIANLQAPGTPAYDAGVEQDDQITEVEGKAISTLQHLQEAIAARKPGDQLKIAFKRRNGPATTATIRLREDPALEAVLLEDTGAKPTAAQQAFRNAWLGSRIR